MSTKFIFPTVLLLVCLIFGAVAIPANASWPYSILPITAAGGPPHDCTGADDGASDPCRCCGIGGRPNDVVDMYSGNLTVWDMPVSYQCAGEPIPFVVYYNLTGRQLTPGGGGAVTLGTSKRWSHSYNVEIHINNPPGTTLDGVYVQEGNGWTHYFYYNLDDDSYTPIAGVQDTLEKTYNGGTWAGWKLTRLDGHKLFFSTYGVLYFIVDSNGLTWSLNYTGTGRYFRLATITDPLNRVTTLDYTYYSQPDYYYLTRVTVPDGRHADFGYTVVPGQSTTYGTGPTSITDAAGDTYTFSYSGSYALASRTDPSGRQINYTLIGGGGKVASISVYGDSNSMVSYAWENSNTSHPGVQWGTVTRKKNGSQVKTRYTHRDDVTTQYRGTLLTKIRDLNGLNLTEAWNYDSLMRMTQYRDSYQAETGGKVHRSWYFYTDPANPFLPTWFVDGENYNGAETPPDGWTPYDGNGNETCPSYQYQYDARGNLTKLTTPEDRVTDYTYESGSDRLSSIIVRDQNRLGQTYDHTTSFTYDTTHGYQLSSVTDARGNTTSYYYGTDWRLQQVHPASGGDVYFTYNNAGDVASVTDGNGNTTSYAWDGIHRLVQVTFPDVGNGQKSQVFNWTCCGLDSVTDENGIVTDYAYDSYTKRLTDVYQDTAGFNYNTHYGYDEVGNLISIRNARNNTTTLTYDKANRLTRADYPDSTYETWAYRDDNRVYQRTDARGRTTTFRYDADDRLWGPAGSGYVAVNYPNDSDVNISRDKDGNITSFTDASGTTNIAYYPGGWVKDITDGYSKTVSYDYSPTGNISKLTAPGGQKWFTYNYTSRDALDWVKDQDDLTLASFTYDNGGRLTRTTRPGSYIAYQYNARNWLTAVQNRAVSGDTTLYDAEYSYQDGALWDNIGNPLKKVENFLNIPLTYTTTLRYDNLSRMTEETQRDSSQGTPINYSRTYQYDAVGNRTQRYLNDYGTTATVNYTYDTNDKLTSADDNSTFGYDNNGNLTSVSGPLGTWSLSYNDANRLSSVTHPGGTDSFTYNSLGHRMRDVIGSNTHRYVYNGDRVLEQTDDNGSTLARYTPSSPSYYGPLLHFKTSDGNMHYPLYDSVGTVRRLADGSTPTPNITDYYSSDAFGLEVGAWGPTTNPYRFGGAWGYNTDTPGSGLLQLGARYYWPEIGRFIQQDPIRDGSNWYAYANNNPVTGIDPEGLIVDTIADIGFIGWDIYDLVKCPTWGKAGWLAADVGLALVPFVPNAITRVGRLGGKAARGGAHAAEAASKIEHMHHLLPVQYADEFARAGLDIEKFKTPLKESQHIRKPNGIHTNAGGNWNRRWKEFFKEHPNASQSEILEYLGKLRKEFGI